MNRYTDHLVEAYSGIPSVRARLTRPPRLFSSIFERFSSPKYGVYLDQLIWSLWAVMRARSADVIHIADHSDAVQPVALLTRAKVVVTCHDLFAVRAALGQIPEFQPQLLGRLYQKRVRRGLMNAAVILCVSDATMEDVRACIPGAKARVLRNSVDVALLSDDRPSESMTNLGEFVLLVGGSDWRKDRGSSVALWVKLSVARNLALVVVGPPLTDAEVNLIPRSMVSAVHVLESVSDADLRRLYLNAIALLQMSKYEGFCWPVAEANWAGTVAICRNIPILKQTGPSNLFIHPEELNLINTDATIGECQSDARRRAVRDYAHSHFAPAAFRARLSVLLQELVSP